VGALPLPLKRTFDIQTQRCDISFSQNYLAVELLANLQ
jgi:hypothetical protein